MPHRRRHRVLRCSRCHRIGSRKFTRDGTATVCSNTRGCVMRQSHRLFRKPRPHGPMFTCKGIVVHHGRLDPLDLGVLGDSGLTLKAHTFTVGCDDEHC